MEHVNIQGYEGKQKEIKSIQLQIVQVQECQSVCYRLWIYRMLYITANTAQYMKGETEQTSYESTAYQTQFE